MAKRSRERRAAAHIADQLHERGRRSRCDDYVGALELVMNRCDLAVTVEGFAAPLMDDPSGGADVRVAERGDVVLEEVDQATFALEKGEQLESGFDGRGGGTLHEFLDELLHNDRLGGGERRHRLAHCEDAGGEGGVEEHAKEADPGEQKALEDAW